MPTGGDVEYEILYRVTQRTTAKPDKQPQVIERFKREIALQFGSSCDIEVGMEKRRTKKK